MIQTPKAELKLIRGDTEVRAKELVYYTDSRHEHVNRLFVINPRNSHLYLKTKIQEEEPNFNIELVSNFHIALNVDIPFGMVDGYGRLQLDIYFSGGLWKSLKFHTEEELSTLIDKNIKGNGLYVTWSHQPGILVDSCLLNPFGMYADSGIEVEYTGCRVKHPAKCRFNVLLGHRKNRKNNNSNTTAAYYIVSDLVYDNTLNPNMPTIRYKYDWHTCKLKAAKGGI